MLVMVLYKSGVSSMETFDVRSIKLDIISYILTNQIQYFAN